MFLNQFYTAADVLAAQTPLSEETDVTPIALPASTSVTLTPAEYGWANQSTLYLNNRALTSLEPVVARAVSQHCVDTIDQLVQTKMRTATNIFRAQNRASTVTVTGTDLLRATDIRKSVTTLRANVAAPRDGQFYVGVFHPDVIHDLREETGSGSWRVPSEYGVSQGQIWNGEFGAFEGVRFISTPTTLRAADNDGATSEIVHRSFILGREALAKAVVNAPEMVDSPVTDKLRRFVGLGWKADLDFAVYRQAAIIQLQSASSLT
jgi:N4-gp56 family major capsid protein